MRHLLHLCIDACIVGSCLRWFSSGLHFWVPCMCAQASIDFVFPLRAYMLVAFECFMCRFHVMFPPLFMLMQPFICFPLFLFTFFVNLYFRAPGLRLLSFLPSGLESCIYASMHVLLAHASVVFLWASMRARVDVSLGFDLICTLKLIWFVLDVRLLPTTVDFSFMQFCLYSLP